MNFIMTLKKTLDLMWVAHALLIPNPLSKVVYGLMQWVELVCPQLKDTC